jgi:hypothetical protein
MKSSLQLVFVHLFSKYTDIEEHQGFKDLFLVIKIN